MCNVCVWLCVALWFIVFILHVCGCLAGRCDSIPAVVLTYVFCVVLTKLAVGWSVIRTFPGPFHVVG